MHGGNLAGNHQERRCHAEGLQPKEKHQGSDGRQPAGRVHVGRPASGIGTFGACPGAAADYPRSAAPARPRTPNQQNGTESDAILAGSRVDPQNATTRNVNSGQGGLR
uniref:(northern house mosquito) hypothetical protein n=1 Tax=Culex pipiens TaxID=7175 RepID=A0A8D8K3T0_CULPI